MPNLAWDVLRSKGKLTSATLSRLPRVTVTSARPIELAYRGAVPGV